MALLGSRKVHGETETWTSAKMVGRHRRLAEEHLARYASSGRRKQAQNMPRREHRSGCWPGLHSCRQMAKMCRLWSRVRQRMCPRMVIDGRRRPSELQEGSLLSIESGWQGGQHHAGRRKGSHRRLGPNDGLRPRLLTHDDYPVRSQRRVADIHNHANYAQSDAAEGQQGGLKDRLNFRYTDLKGTRGCHVRPAPLGHSRGLSQLRSWLRD
jgi:hypothetical protein